MTDVTGESGWENGTFDALVLRIWPDELDPPRIGAAMAQLLPLAEDPQKVRHYRQRLLLEVCGWGDVALVDRYRQLRPFMQALDAQWPYWMHFLSLEDDQWAMLLRCLLPDDDPAFVPGSVYSRRLAYLSARWSTAMVYLYRASALEHAQGDAVAEQATRMMERALRLAPRV